MLYNEEFLFTDFHGYQVVLALQWDLIVYHFQTYLSVPKCLNGGAIRYRDTNTSKLPK